MNEELDLGEEIGVGKAGARSYETYSLQSMLAVGNTLETNLLLFCIFGDNITEGTMHTIFQT